MKRRWVVLCEDEHGRRVGQPVYFWLHSRAKNYAAFQNQAAGACIRAIVGAVVK